MVAEVVAILLHELYLPFQLGRVPKVVAVEEGNPAPPCPLQCSVARNSRAAVFLVTHIYNTGVFGHERFHYLARIVGRTVVNDNEFPVLISLCLYTLDTFCNILPTIVRGHND